MAVDMFLKIDGIPGESQDAKHKDEINVLSFHWGVTQTARSKARASARASVQDFSIVKFVDKASPLLMMAACQGDHLPDVIFSVDRAGEVPLNFLKVTFTDVLVSSYRPGGSSGGQSDIPLEEVSFNFSKIEVTYTQQTETGKPGQETTGSCNFLKH